MELWGKSLCFVGNMEADTKERDDILLDLYDKAAFDEGYSFDEFTSYMAENVRSCLERKRYA